MPDEKDKIHNIHTEYVKNNILKINLEFNPEYTEDTKNLNYTSIFWKNLETNEISKITLNSDNGLLDENLVQWDENITYKSALLWDAKLSKESYLMDNYWNNVFNFFNDKDSFYKIYQSNGNYIKIKTTDSVCEMITGNENNQNLVSMEQKIELDIVSDSDIEQIDKSKIIKNSGKNPNLVSLEITKYDLENNLVTVTITDNNEVPYSLNDRYKIEKKNEDSWEELNRINPETTLLIKRNYTLDENNQYDFIINWINDYGELEVGIYRIVKEFEGDIFYSNEFKFK